MDELTYTTMEGGPFTLADPKPQTITWVIDGVTVLTMTKDRIIGNPAVPADDAATAMLRALESMIRALK